MRRIKRVHSEALRDEVYELRYRAYLRERAIEPCASERVVALQRAEYAIAAVRMNHLPFYKRVLRLERASEGRVYPGLSSIMYLTACQFQQNIQDVYERTPLLRPKGYERMLMDEQYQDVWEVGLPIEDQALG